MGSHELLNPDDARPGFLEVLDLMGDRVERLKDQQGVIVKEERRAESQRAERVEVGGEQKRDRVANRQIEEIDAPGNRAEQARAPAGVVARSGSLVEPPHYVVGRAGRSDVDRAAEPFFDEPEELGARL